jgi:ABC-type transporter Mla MlaB component
MNKRKEGTATRATRRRHPARDAPAAETPGDSGSVCFAVAAECTIADAGALKTGLAKLLEEPGIVTLDVGAMRRIDTAGLQVIATFVRERQSHGREVQWRGTAPALSAAAQLLGLGALLGLPTAAHVESAR